MFDNMFCTRKLQWELSLNTEYNREYLSWDVWRVIDANT